MRLDLGIDVTTRDGLQDKDARLTNMLVEQDSVGKYATIRPGLNLKLALTGGGGGLVSFNGQLVAVSGANLSSVKEDLTFSNTTFTPSTPSLYALRDICAGNELVAVGSRLAPPYTGWVIYGDGVNWANGFIGDGLWNSVAWNGSVYCAVRYGKAATSPDGSTWTEYNLSANVGGFVEAYNGNFYTAHQEGTRVAVSTDNGQTWMEYLTPFRAANFSMFCVCEKGILIGGHEYNTLNPITYLSPDFGLTWLKGDAEKINNTSNTWSVAYGNGRFIASTITGPTTGNTLLFSTDGRNWVTLSAPQFGNVTFYNGNFFISNSATKVSASKNGVNWYTESFPYSKQWLPLVGEGFGSDDMWTISGSTAESISLNVTYQQAANSIAADLDVGQYDFTQSTL